MIIKVVERKAGERSSFDQLGRYILNAKQNESVLFTRTAEYVMDLNGDGEKVAWYRVSNCQSDAPVMAIAEVLATQAENTRSKSDKTYHLVVSLPHWERLSREQAADIEDTICTGLGLTGHQRVSAVHQDTDHSHLHIAINKIHPTTFRCIEPYYPYFKLDSVAKELEIKHGLHHDNRIGQGKRFAKVGELEAHQQEESFAHWLHENLGEQLKEVLKNARGWQDLHELFTAYGALIKPRGAGLAIATLDGKLGIKASSLDRKLSFKTLTGRFGEYEPPRDQHKQCMQYQKDSQSPSGVNSLYAEYQRSRQTKYELKTKALAELRTEYGESRSKLKDWYHERRASVKSNKQLSNKTKRAAYHDLFEEMKQDFAGLKQDEQQQRKSIREQSSTQTWDEYLAARAAQGDVEALGILRRRKNRRTQISQALLTVDNIEDALDVVKPHFKPTVLKNGRVIYRSHDGGVVYDEATAISVPQVTEAAALMALSLADERFRGKALNVEGSLEFKRQIAKLSVMHGLTIRFADPALERDRRYHVRADELIQRILGKGIQEKGKQPEQGESRDYQGR